MAAICPRCRRPAPQCACGDPGVDTLLAWARRLFKRQEVKR